MIDSIFDCVHDLSQSGKHTIYLWVWFEVLVFEFYPFFFQTIFNCIKIGKFHIFQCYTLIIADVNANMHDQHYEKMFESSAKHVQNYIAIFPVHWRWSFTCLVNMTALHLLLLVLYSIFISLICISFVLLLCSMRRIRNWPMYNSKQN